MHAVRITKNGALKVIALLDGIQLYRKYSLHLLAGYCMLLHYESMHVSRENFHTEKISYVQWRREVSPLEIIVCVKD